MAISGRKPWSTLTPKISSEVIGRFETSDPVTWTWAVYFTSGEQALMKKWKLELFGVDTWCAQHELIGWANMGRADEGASLALRRNECGA